MSEPRRKRPTRGLRHDTNGSVFVEASLVMPLTVLILAGIMEWGLALYQFNLLSTATANAVRQLIVSRGYNTPYTDVLAQYGSWAKTLDVDPSMVKVFVDGDVCVDDTECKDKLNDALGTSASVEVKFPCTLQFIPTVVSPCPITLSMTGLVE